jgi:hypothetical protein
MFQQSDKLLGLVQLEATMPEPGEELAPHPLAIVGLLEHPPQLVIQQREADLAANGRFVPYDQTSDGFRLPAPGPRDQLGKVRVSMATETSSRTRFQAVVFMF